MSGGGIASRFTWVFGKDPDANAGAGTHGAHNNVANSTGAGVAFNTHGWGLQYTFLVETNDSGWGYQIRVGRTSSGPWRILSSNSGTSTSTLDVVQIPGPFAFVSPLWSDLASTANYGIVRMTAVE